MEQPNAAIENGGFDNFMPGNSQNVAYHHVFQVLGLTGRLAHGENGSGGSYCVGDANKSFQRNALVAGAHKRKYQCANEGEAQAHPVSALAMGIHASQNGDSRAQSSDLGQRQINEDDPALHYMNAQVSMDASQNQAGQEWKNQELENFHRDPIWSPEML